MVWGKSHLEYALGRETFLMNKFAFILLSIFVFVVSVGLGAYVATNPIGGTAGPFNPSGWDNSKGTVYKDVVYGDAPANKLDLYVPADKSRESYGLAIYLHAGGFTGGDKSDDADILKSFVLNGYVAAGVNYTLRSAENPTASITSMTEEVKRGIAAACAKAEELGYKLNGMAVCGGSAGGCLALVYAYRDAAEAPVPVRCCIEMVGPAVFEPEAWYGMGGDYSKPEVAERAAAWVSVMTGDAITPEMMASGEYKDHLVKISGYALVNENSVPTLAGYGALDRVSTPQSAQYLEDALSKYGVPHDVVIFPKSGHGLNRDSKIAKVFFGKFEEYLSKYLPVL